MPDSDGPAVTSAGKMAAAGLSVAPRRGDVVGSGTAGWGWGRQRLRLHREQESVSCWYRPHNRNFKRAARRPAHQAEAEMAGQAGKTLMGWRR